ncbi:MAG: TlpA family protein disulfide reductase [Thermoplasmata archaeon]|nr:MAG: TlpA family protein disulfide reductase [Thermoplasmata archaeon]
MDEKEPDKENLKANKVKQFLKGNIIIIVVIILIIVLAYILIRPFFIDLVGEKAPNFNLKSIDGEEIKLSDNFGKVIILDIMTTTCPPCISEMEHLKGVYNRYPSEELVIMTISIDNSDSNEDLSTFREKYGDNWTFARDTDDVENKYNVRYTPTIVIIDREGIIRHYHEGETSFQTLSKEVERLI